MTTINYFNDLKEKEDIFFSDMITYLDVNSEDIFDANDLNNYLSYFDVANEGLWFTTFDYLPIVTSEGIENDEVDLNDSTKKLIKQQTKQYDFMLSYNVNITDSDKPKPLTNGDVLKYIKSQIK